MIDKILTFLLTWQAKKYEFILKKRIIDHKIDLDLIDKGQYFA